MAVRETVLITGASSGIGRELAKLFAGGGANLVLVARREKELQNLAQHLKNMYGTESRVVPADLANADAPQQILQQLRMDRVAVDVVVNNAGLGAVGRVAELEMDRQLNMIHVNITSLTALTRLFLPEIIKRNHGGILNVASTAGFLPGPNMAVYYATKAYVLSFTEALAEELTETGVTVTCLAPGPTATGFGAESGVADARLFRLARMDARSVAQSGYDGFRNGSVVVIPGLTNKASMMSLRAFPRMAVRKFVKYLNS